MSNSILQAFKSLQVSKSGDSANDHEQIYEVSYQYLSKIKNFDDLKSFNNCIIALINLDRYNKAYEIFKKVPVQISSQFPLEKAYVYYKLGLNDNLVKLYQEINESKINHIELRAITHILAQSYYQSGQISKSLDLYHGLIKSNSNIDSESDLSCNELAIISQLPPSADGKPISTVEDLNSYDYLFNKSLIEIKHGNYEKSLSILNQAIEKCESINMGVSSDDLALELAPLKLTVAYIHQTLGQPSKSLEILQDNQLSGITDLMIQLIIKNNLVSIENEIKINDVNLVHRDLNYQYNIQHLKQKLTKAQYYILIKNNLLLSFQSGTLSKSSSYLSNKFLESYFNHFPNDYTPIIYKILLKLSIHIDDLFDKSSYKAVSRKIFKFITDSLEEKQLTAAVLLLIAVNVKMSTYTQTLALLYKLLNSNSKIQSIPSIMGVLIQVYDELNLTSKSDELYEELLNGLSEQSLKEEVAYNFARSFAFKAKFHFDNHNNPANKFYASKLTKADEILQKLREINPHDELVNGLLSYDSTNLKPVEELESREDINQLLATDINTLIPPPPPQPVKVKPAKVVKKSQKPKFGKTKFYKPDSEFKPEEDLDKERWLPLKLRSYYKPSKKDKKRGGHQGVVETTPQPSTPEPPKAAAAAKKKKKKGKK